METKGTLHVEIKDAEKGLVTAVFSTLGVIDLHGDVTEPGAFEDGAAVRISAWNHASWSGATPVGRGTIHASDTEAWMDGQFFLSTTAGRDHFEVVKELGELCEWSYGFDVLESADGEQDERPVRFLRKLRTIEVSPVLRGAGIDTRTLAVKGSPGAPSAQEIAQAVVEAQASADAAAAERRREEAEEAKRDQYLRVVAACHGIDTTGGDR